MPNKWDYDAPLNAAMEAYTKHRSEETRRTVEETERLVVRVRSVADQLLGGKYTVRTQRARRDLGMEK